jgi:hypothetical protein
MSHCSTSHHVHYGATSASHVALSNLLVFHVATKFCAHLHDVQEGGLSQWLKNF